MHVCMVRYEDQEEHFRTTRAKYDYWNYHINHKNVSKQYLMYNISMCQFYTGIILCTFVASLTAQ